MVVIGLRAYVQLNTPTISYLVQHTFSLHIRILLATASLSVVSLDRWPSVLNYLDDFLSE